ncbi:MAG: ABC transporter ATP-binding protein, partial [Candidatus Bipolaricaulaceae bacterium]
SKAPQLLIANQPTRGLDVAATRYIRDLLLRLRDEGLAILLVSADLDEIFELADRVAVMFRGTFTGVVPAEELDRERIGLLMGGVAAQGARE